MSPDSTSHRCGSGYTNIFFELNIPQISPCRCLWQPQKWILTVPNRISGLNPTGTPHSVQRLLPMTGHTLCFKTCVHQFIESEPNMNPGEQTCMDRCTHKFFEAHQLMAAQSKVAGGTFASIPGDAEDASLTASGHSTHHLFLQLSILWGSQLKHACPSPTLHAFLALKLVLSSPKFSVRRLCGV